MRQLAVLPLLLSTTAAWDFAFPNFWDSPSQLPLSAPESSTPSSPRVAIVGAGAAGSSSAFWISKAKERFGLDVDIDIYERSDYIGGRSTTVYPYGNASFAPIELGASIFVPGNKNMWRASEEFNLTRANWEGEDSGLMGIWDGQAFVLTQGTVGGTVGSWFDTVKVLWRYGFSAPHKAQTLVKTMVDKFQELYHPNAIRWSNISALSEAFDWSEQVSQTGSEYFQSKGVPKLFITELIEAATRVNYAQDVDTIHGLESAVSLAANGASAIASGNWRVFDAFVERSGARKLLNTEVKSVQRKSDELWTVKSTAGSADYRAVILAAPYHSTSISLPSAVAASIPEQPYVHLHVTLLSTTAPAPNATYFGLKEGAKVPTTVLTTLDGVRRGGVAPEFNSLTYHGPIVDAATGEATEEMVVKIFSMAPVSNAWLGEMFQGQVGWVLRKEWDAYPILPPTTSFPPVKLDRGLYYVNAFEPLISTMETETIAARNVVDLLLAEEFQTGICAPAAEGSDEPPAPTKADFVYGWDC
ncbi:FAD/NAD-P-binding domain-containing protein [Amylostereum chailletii]|nr:FAD/NAD-P-binding domain-containing protein [Amylostereum chailletii]